MSLFWAVIRQIRNPLVSFLSVSDQKVNFSWTWGFFFIQKNIKLTFNSLTLMCTRGTWSELVVSAPFSVGPEKWDSSGPGVPIASSFPPFKSGSARLPAEISWSRALSQHFLPEMPILGLLKTSRPARPHPVKERRRRNEKGRWARRHR